MVRPLFDSESGLVIFDNKNASTHGFESSKLRAKPTADVRRKDLNHRYISILEDSRPKVSKVSH